MFSVLISEDTSSKLPTFFRLNQWYIDKKSHYSMGSNYFLEVLKLVKI